MSIEYVILVEYRFAPRAAVAFNLPDAVEISKELGGWDWDALRFTVVFPTKDDVVIDIKLITKVGMSMEDAKKALVYNAGEALEILALIDRSDRSIIMRSLEKEQLRRRKGEFELIMRHGPTEQQIEEYARSVGRVWLTKEDLEEIERKAGW